MIYNKQIQDFAEDGYGRQLHVGRLVAFNRSGDVKKGVIIEIKMPVTRLGQTFCKWSGKPYADVKVRDLDGKVSVVKNLGGIILI